MAKTKEPRVGGQVNDIFSSTVDTTLQKKVPEEKTVAEKKHGRPKQLPDNHVKSTVTFYNSQVVWLDRLSAEIRYNTMKKIDRGAIIRAFISAMEESRIDFGNITSEENIKEIILSKLKK